VKNNVVLFIVCGLLSAIAETRPITFAFTRAVDNDPFGVFGGASFAGTYTFDSTMPQVLATSNSGGYAGTGPLFSMSVAFAAALDPSVSGPYTADSLNITVNRNFPGPLDEYLVTGRSSNDGGLSIELTLDDFTATAFASTVLPLLPPSLSAFASPRFALFGGTLDNPIEAEGVLRTLRCTSGCAAIVAEPDPMLLFAAAMCALALVRRRGRPARSSIGLPTARSRSILFKHSR